jgi:hypothetical protein
VAGLQEEGGEVDAGAVVVKVEGDAWGVGSDGVWDVVEVLEAFAFEEIGFCLFVEIFCFFENLVDQF